MGGGPKQETKSNQTTRSEPWAPAQPLLNSLVGTIGGQYGGVPTSPGMQLPSVRGLAGLSGYASGGGMVQPGGQPFNVGLTGAEGSALDALSANAANAGRYAPQIGNLANDLLAGGTDRTGMVNEAYNEFRGNLQPYTTASTDPYQNPAFTKAVDYMSGDILDRIKSQYAGAGYSPTGAGDFAQRAGEGISRGIAPTWLQAQSELENRKGSAIRDLLAAGGSTAGLLSGLDQTALGNRQAGIGVGQAGLAAENAPYQQALAIEAERRGIPLRNIAQLESLIIPMAQLGGTQQSQGTQTTETQVPFGQQLLGAGLAGAGLLSGMGGFGGVGGMFTPGGLFGPSAGFASGGMGMVPTFGPNGGFSYNPRWG